LVESAFVWVSGPEDYLGFEAAIICDYDARTAVERKLVLRLAPQWRGPRADLGDHFQIPTAFPVRLSASPQLSDVEPLRAQEQRHLVRDLDVIQVREHEV
jgi:hypothetical protein